MLVFLFLFVWLVLFFFFFFFFNDTATTEIYTLSLHDALPILILISSVMAVLHEPQHDSEQARNQYQDRKSTRLNSSHVKISYAVFCLKKKKKKQPRLDLKNKKNYHITSK